MDVKQISATIQMSVSLETRIKGLIKTDGPIDVATYMQLCLSDPHSGYYTTRKPIGQKGDFTTAPEISQLFGEMIGIWIIDTWQKLGSPNPFSLIEAGPGRGTLMADCLRTIEKLSAPCALALHVHLIEISGTLKAMQQETLSGFDGPLFWHSTIDEIEPQPFILIGNEFLDALPIHQYQFQDGKWAERAIGLSEDNTLAWGLIPTRFQSPLTPKEGDIFEICVEAQKFMSTLCERCASEKGATLLIDYGHLKSGFGDTFQAMKNHHYSDPLEAPGSADLTAHVDFKTLANIALDKNLECHSTTQGAFLLAMGLLERAGALGAGLDVEAQEKIQSDVERLAARDKMGDLFKVMTLSTSGITPHGF